jgi:ribonuclease R
MTSNDKQARRRVALLDELRRAAGKPLGVNELMQRAHLHPGERTDAKRSLRDLVQEGLALRDGKRYALAGAKAAPSAERGELKGPPRAGGRKPLGGKGIVGTLSRHRDGFGFVARLDRAGEDVFVPPKEAAKALDGDLVRLAIVPGRGGRTMGEILEVVERRRRMLIGTYHSRGADSFVVPFDAELGGAVPVGETGVARDGDVVKVALDPESRALRGAVVESVGRPGSPRAEVLRVAYGKGFSDVFPASVEAEAREVPEQVRDEDRVGRRDLRHLPLVTIDGEDARDFDDAVWVERLPARKGRREWRLLVAIADVSHYVRPGTALDGEAVRRATSVYFPMQVLPMLPERLSNGICSLNPDVDRLCMVADMVIDERGETHATEIYEGVMRSAARCTYTEVARVLVGEAVPHRERFRPSFEQMAELQEALGAMRRRRGSIDFDIAESRVVLDPDGNVVGIEKRPRNRAHRIVEEFMLAANEAVAHFFGSRKLPTIYRVHGVPDEEKLENFLALARTHGFAVPELPVDPRALNSLLEKFKGHAQQRALNQLLLRAMMQAIYSDENIGHYGLAAEHYLHFTSPIRRYPDLVVHRLLKEEWAKRRGDGARRTDPKALAELAAISSDRERASMLAEREIAAFYAALFMKDKVGERFNGVVAAVAEPGLFVELRPYAVEGLVKTEDLPGDFELDPVQHALVDRRTRRAYRVGDEIEVDLVASSPQRRQIDLRLAGTVAAVAPPEGPKGPRERLSMPPRSPGAARPAGKGRGAPKGGHGERGGRTRSGNGHAEKARTGGGQGGKKGTGGGHKGRRRGR